MATMDDTTQDVKWGSRDELCQKIDAVLLQFFSVLSQLFDVQAQLETKMKSGFLNLSRARYSMGMKFVSVQQYDESKMEASLRLQLNGDKDEEMVVLEKLSDLNLESDKTNPVKESSGLRQRKVGSKEAVGEDSTEMVKEISARETDDDSCKDGPIDDCDSFRKPYDPIRWFGVLVPPALRQSQKEFRGSVENCITLVNLRRQLTRLQSEYKDLLKQKHALFPEKSP